MPPVTQTTAASTLMLVDSATVYYRSFFALPESMTAPNGHPNNAIRGFLDSLSRLVASAGPAGLICAWDGDWRPQFRIDAWPGYKAHRVADDGGEEEPDTLGPQVTALAEVLDAMGICRLAHPDFEADDILATAAAHANSLGYSRAEVVTSDRDLFQCVDDAAGVRVLSIAKGVAKPEVIDGSEVMARYSVSAAQYRDFATMRGDASDGMPGVPGIGEKTAAALLAEFGTLAAIRAAAADASSSMKPGLRRKLLDAEPSLDALTLVTTVVRDVPLGEVWPDLPATVHDETRLDELCDQWGIRHPVRQLMAITHSGKGT